jgi:hypothetical protein|tara:strand:- start:571 stop:768 length:198 start_codon:yes stop_codon:yes gene_type:complete
MKLSDQALGSIMMCLQRCILKQEDITSILKNLDFYPGNDDSLYVENPPTFEALPDQPNLDNVGSD